MSQITGRNSTNQSVERALQVLKVFGDHELPLHVSDIARLCNLGTSTTSRLLSTLLEAGLLEKNVGNTYQLSRSVITLAGAALNQSQLCREARPIAYAASCELGLGVNVAERRDNYVFYLLHFDGRLAPRARTLMGKRNPLHTTGLGKCLLSEASPHELRELFAVAPPQPYTPKTILALDSFESELAFVRQRGLRH